MTSFRQTYLEVDLDTLYQNARIPRESLPKDVLMMAVVKANAYGHGAVQASRAFLRAGADWLAVALAEEGVVLRDAGITAPILVLTPLNAAGFLAAAQYSLTASLHSLRNVHDAVMAAQKYGALDVHVAVDTGLNRDGFHTMSEWQQAVEILVNNPSIRVTGAFTHYADGENEDESFSRQQQERFMDCVAMLPKGIVLHTSSSSPMLHYPDMMFNMVRPGIVLYGYPPYPTNLVFQPAMSFLTEITATRTIEKGDTVSYGRTYKADKPHRIATLAAGYGDGVPRALSNLGSVIIHGEKCPIVGRVCMDQLMVDITKIPHVEVGDQAILMGGSGVNSITAQDMADLLHTISYEVLLLPSSRVPVRYAGLYEEDDFD